MSKSFVLPLMYGMVLIPSLITIVLMRDPHYDLFVIHVLLYFTLTVLSRFLRQHASILMLAVIGILFSSWLCLTYGNLMFIVAVTPLFLYLPLRRNVISLIMISFHAVALNYGVMHQPLIWIATSNLFLFIIAVLVSLIQQSEYSKSTSLLMYDDLRRKHYELDESRNRLVQFSKQVEGFAQAEERNRISQQLHDDVGHRLIRVKMMMEAALQIMPSDGQKGILLMEQIRDQLGTGLDEMRSSVRRMKPSPHLTGLHAIGNMLEEIGRETGVRTNLKIEGTQADLYPSQEIILYRNAREAITNALRHGGAKSIDVVITYGPHELSMAVSNDGVIPEDMLQRGTGLGITGMRERCEVAGGHLEFIMLPRFTVTTKLPINPH